MIGTVGAVEDAGALRLRGWWRSVPPLLADGLLAVVVLAVSLTEVALDDGIEGGSAWRTVLLVAMSAVIVFRRRSPVPVWLASGVLVAIYGVGEFPDPTLPYAPLIAVYTATANVGARAAAWVGVVTGATVVASLLIDPYDDLLDWLIAMLSVTTAWLVGNNVRVQRAYGEAMAARAADLERDRVAAAERAVADERLRLARELHDVAAHHVSVIALHAEAGQSLLPAHPDRADETFAVIGDVARATLTELRRVVGVLRDGDAVPFVPQPGLRHLPALVAEVEQAGVPVLLRVAGEPRPIGDAVDASAYRIVQEALTNVLRHAAGCARRGHRDLRPRRGVVAGDRRWDGERGGGAAGGPRSRRDARAGGRVRRVADDGTAARGWFLRVGAASRMTRRVVIADDQDLVRAGLRVILETNGVDVVAEAADGAEAVAAALTHRPDVVLMDVRMPVVDGIEATRRIRGVRRRRACARRHDVRPRRVRVRGAAGRRQRVPAQGRAACRVASRHRGRRRR